MIDFIPVLIYFFAVIDPIGTLPVFIAATKQHTPVQRRVIALMAFVTSSVILLFFIVAGEIILTAMHIPLAAFQVAGGIVLFIFALTMIFGESKPEQEIKMAATIRETAVFPIAVPSIASPGAMLAAVLLTKNNVYTLPKHLDEKVAKLHLKHLGVEIESLSENQAQYIGVNKNGPYKPDYYRY